MIPSPSVVGLALALFAISTSGCAQPIRRSSGQQTRQREKKKCEPFFKATDYFRGVPHVFVDQGLESLPHVYPKHVLLVQRRDSELGTVRYSLLVYRQDAAKPDVT